MPRHFGLLVPSTNTTCEIELGRLPGELQLHTGRLGKAGKSPFQPSLDADVAYQSKMLGDARVEIIALAQTSASLFADDYCETTVKRMTESSGGIASITSAQAVGRALKALGVERIAFATPYSEEVIARARRYYERRYGMTVVATESLGATDSYAIGKMDAGLVGKALEKLDSPQIQAFVVPGGNFPTMDSVAGWEKRFGKPVVTTNAATAWAVMQHMQLSTPMAGKGRLLEQLPKG